MIIKPMCREICAKITNLRFGDSEMCETENFEEVSEEVKKDSKTGIEWNKIKGKCEESVIKDDRK